MLHTKKLNANLKIFKIELIEFYNMPLESMLMCYIQIKNQKFIN